MNESRVSKILILKIYLFGVQWEQLQYISFFLQKIILLNCWRIFKENY